MANQPEVWHIYPHVVYADGTNYIKGKVQAFDIVNGKEVYLGEGGLDATGHTTITYSRAQFQNSDPNKPSPVLKLKVIEYIGNKIIHETILYPLIPSEFPVEIVLGLRVIPDDWKVVGEVKFTDCSPFVNGKVKAFDVSPAGEFLLGEATLSNLGKYEINFKKEAFQHTLKSKPRPYIRIRVYDIKGNEVGHSEVVFQPKSFQIINVGLKVAKKTLTTV